MFVNGDACKQMLYLYIKLLHIISSTILFGTGLGTACSMVFAHRTRDVHIIANTSRYVVLADWVFTGSSGIVQPVTGFWMVSLQLSIIFFLAMGCCDWYLIAVLLVSVVYLQIK